MPTRDMFLHKSKVDHQFLTQFCSKYAITPQFNPTPPHPDHRNVTDCPRGYIALYTKFFEISHLRLPFSNFLLTFLKQFKLTISQLSPIAAMKLSHFEIVCRALGGEPSLPLFSQFFRLVRYGDWYMVRNRRDPTFRCLSWSSRRVYPWKDYFFWVSAEAVPFKMHWRQPHELFDDDVPGVFDGELYGMLVNHPMPLQLFPEHVLIMAGLSRNWPYDKAEPIIKDGDQEMGLTDFIEMKGLNGVKLTSRLLAENEDHILKRTEGVCYEAGPSNVVQSEEVDVNKGGPDDMEIHPQTLIFDSDTEVDSPVVPDTGGVQLDQVSGSKRRRLVKAVSPNVVVLSSGGKSAATEKGCDVVVEAARKRCTKRHGKRVVISEPGESSDEAGETSDDQKVAHMVDPRVLDRVGRLEQLVTISEKKVKTEARLRERVKRYRLQVTVEAAKNKKLVKKVKKLKKLKKVFVEKEKQATVMVATNTLEHAKVVEGLKKELEDAHAQSEEKLKEAHEKEVALKGEIAEKLKQAHEQFEQQKEKLKHEHDLQTDNWRQERVALNQSLERVAAERQWLIEDGFGYVINKLHKSREYLKPLGAVQSKLWSAGAHCGLIEGYAHCKTGVALEDASLYDPEAHRQFLNAVHELENTRFEYVVALSRCTDRTLDELKGVEPVGMEGEENEAADDA